MKIFKNQPKVTRSDAARLLPHLSNFKVTKVWLSTKPDINDLKRAAILEVLRAKESYQAFKSLNRGVLRIVLKRIQELEASRIDDKIRTYLLNQ